MQTLIYYLSVRLWKLGNHVIYEVDAGSNHIGYMAAAHPFIDSMYFGDNVMNYFKFQLGLNQLIKLNTK
jgi:hypothetical protein